MQVTQNIWLDDDTFLVDGKTMSSEQIGHLKNLPSRISMSPNNYELFTEVSATKRVTNFDVLKIVLKK